MFITMSVATKLQSSAKLVSEPRAILGPTGNRVKPSEDPKRKPEVAKKPLRPKKPVPKIPEQVIRNNGSVDSACSSDSSSSSASSAKKMESSRRTVMVKRNEVKNAMDSAGIVENSSPIPGPIRRCDWITANSGTLLLFIYLFYDL